MEFQHEMQNGKAYLVYELKEEQETDDFVLGMITNAKIKCLAPVQFMQIDEKKRLKYNLTAKVSVTDYILGRSVYKRQLLGILISLSEAFLEIEDCMLYIDNMVLDWDYIYVDVSSYEVFLVCLPFKVENVAKTMRDFYKQILDKTILAADENSEYFGQLHSYLNSHPVLQIEDFLAYLRELSGDAGYHSTSKQTPVVEIARNVSAGASMPQPVEMGVQQPVHDKNQEEGLAAKPVLPNMPEQPRGMKKLPAKPGSTSAQVGTAPDETGADGKKGGMRSLFEKYKQQMEKKAKKSKDGEPVSQQPQKPDAAQQPFAQIQGSEPVYETPFGGASAFYGSGAEPQISSPTVDLSMAEALSQGPGRAFLKRIKTNDMIEITKKHFKIGKERSYADYCPSDIIGLSRSHANIVTESDGYFITDTNSTNHTYLNGALIPSNQPYKLENGMRVRFANEEFEFIIQES